MALKELKVSGYRSLRRLRLPLAELNIITGPNGSGKSNIYRSMAILAAAARGDLARTLAEEGGMPSVLWAGPRKGKGPARMELGFASDDWGYEVACGLPQSKSGRSRFEPTKFMLDPEVKLESVRFEGPGARPVDLMERKNQTLWLRNNAGKRVSYPLSLLKSEAALSQITEPDLYPELAALRAEMAGWRLYHHFRTDPGSPLRRPQIGVRTPSLDADGKDLAAALQTIWEIGDDRALDHWIDAAFPGAKLIVFEERGRFEVGLEMPGIQRPFEARELSDGTLRYLCLVAVLLSPRPPRVLALNEPETSIHMDLLKPLASLIVEASKSTQILVVSHSETLVTHIEAETWCPIVRLEKTEGETKIFGEENELALGDN